MARPPKYQCNESYFSKISTPNQAYILGFIWADGSLNQRSGLSIAIKTLDKSVLEFILKQTQSNLPIKDYSIKQFGYSKLSINRLAIYNDLVKLGLGSNKSQNNAPIPNFLTADLESHFLRGLFDGDGSIWKASGYKANFSGGLDFLKWVESLLNKSSITCNPIRFRYGKDKPNSCMLDISGQDNIVKLSQFLYRDSEFHLERKYQRFLDAIQHYEKLNQNNWQLNGNNAKVAELFKQGKKAREIADLLNLNHNSVRNCIGKLKMSG